MFSLTGRDNNTRGHIECGARLINAKLTRGFLEPLRLLGVVRFRFVLGGHGLEKMMLSINELQGLTINPAVAREAYLQAEKRLSDSLETKKAFEQKAFFLFNAYTAFALAVFGVVGALYKSGGATDGLFAFLLCGALMVVGAVLFLIALMDSEYGALGSDPDLWLNKGTIDGGENVLPLMQAYITHHHKTRLLVSKASNIRKAGFIRYGMFSGLTATVLLAVFAVIA